MKSPSRPSAHRRPWDAGSMVSEPRQPVVRLSVGGQRFEDLESNWCRVQKPKNLKSWCPRGSSRSVSVQEKEEVTFLFCSIQDCSQLGGVNHIEAGSFHSSPLTHRAFSPWKHYTDIPRNNVSPLNQVFNPVKLTPKFSCHKGKGCWP